MSNLVRKMSNFCIAEPLMASLCAIMVDLKLRAPGSGFLNTTALLRGDFNPRQ